MNDIENFILRTIERYMAGRHHERRGLVTSFDPDNQAAKVMYQPEGFESGWLPIRTNHIGNGWGVVVGLQIDDQVIISFQEGDIETGIITGVVHSDDDKPPRVESGEMLFKHQSGATIKFANDKSMTVTDAGGGTLHFDGSGKATLTMQQVKIVSGDIQFGAA